jgi:hypothetical protein
VILVLGLALAGCGGGDEPERAKVRPVNAVTDAKHRAEVARDPYALTCADLAAQPLSSTNQRLVIDVEFTLSQEPVLRKRVREMTDNRVGRSIYWAMTEICKRSPAAYAPGRDAVEAVRKGAYLVQPRPQSWSKPELWSGTDSDGD